MTANDNEPLLRQGDVALIIGKDGEVRTLACGIDTSRLFLPEDQLTDEDQTLLEQGKRIFALSLAAQSEKIMAMLIAITEDPEMVPEDALKRYLRPI